MFENITNCQEKKNVSLNKELSIMTVKIILSKSNYKYLPNILTT